MTSDFICLVLQAAGGAITSTSGGTSDGAKSLRDVGIDVMIGGLVLQVVSLLLFAIYAGIYFWRWQVATKLRGCRLETNKSLFKEKVLVFGTLICAENTPGLHDSPMLIHPGLAIACTTIFIRSAFRVAELREGFQSSIASNEVLFMVLEGAMICLACLALTIAHPGLCLSIPWKIPKRFSSEHRDDTMSADSGAVVNLQQIKTLKSRWVSLT